MYQDKTLTCRDCGAEFAFTASEQEFFASKGFTNEPSRCPECRAARKQQQNRNGGGFSGNRGGGYDRGPRQMYQVTCSRCGQSCEVPFEPTAGKPVYCRDCYQPRSRY
jgi:CxxC-x17-CxxC domain-containing protein